MSYLRVKNWHEFQHYKDRSPPWIKLHRTLLDDYEFASLPDASKAHLLMIWLLASSNDGRVPSDALFLARKLATTDAIDLKLLIEKGFLVPEQDASTVLAERKQGASTLQAFARSREERREEEKPPCAPEARDGAPAPHAKPDGARTVPRLAGFDRFWAAYPKRRSKAQAEKAWLRLAPDEALVDRIVRAVEVAMRRDDWQREDGRFVPYPASWLNARGWEDEDGAPRRGNGSAQWWLAQGFGSRESAMAAGMEEPA